MATRTRHFKRSASSARRRGAHATAHVAPAARRIASAPGDRHDGTRGRAPEQERASAGHDDDGVGLLFAFVATTMVMVVAICGLALLGGWWWLVPVVFVHWAATYVVFHKINVLLDDA